MESLTSESEYSEKDFETYLEKSVRDGISDSEQAAEYLNFTKKIIKYLEPGERNAFATNPIKFISSINLFRGFPKKTYEQVQNQRFYKPQSGEHGSEGVYFSNRPYSAFTYQNKGVIAVIDPTKFKYKSELGILDTNSPEYTEHSRNYINKMLPMVAPTNHRDFFYQVQNQWDSKHGVPNGPPGEKIIEMRLAQPIEITKIFLVWTDNDIIEVRI